MRRCSGRKFSAWFSLSGLLKGFAAAAVKVGGESPAFIILQGVLHKCCSTEARAAVQVATRLSALLPSPSLPFRRLSTFISHSGRKSVSLSNEDGLISGSLLPGELSATRAHPQAQSVELHPLQATCGSTTVSQVPEQVVLISRVVQLTQE